MSTANDIANLILERGQIAAQGSQNQGAIWGGTLRDLGQTAAAIPTYLQNQQAREQENQIRSQEMQMRQQEMGIRQAQLEEVQRQRQAEQMLDQAYPQFVSPAGELNSGGLADYLAKNGQGHLVPSVLKSAQEYSEAQSKAVSAKAAADDAQAKVAERIGSGMQGILDSGGSIEDAAGFGALHVKAGVTSGLIPRDDGASLLASMDPSNPDRVKATIGRLKNAAGAPKGQPIGSGGLLLPNNQIIPPQARPTAAPAPKVPTNAFEAALIATAKDPTKPTAAEFTEAQAMAAKDASQEPIVTIRTMENGKPVEKVLPRSEAVGKTFQSQPPASIIYPKPEAGQQPEIVLKPGTQQYRVAQDVAYGNLTMADFNRIYGRAMGNAATKQAIYDTARQLNPDFNPAQFELGFRMAGNPQIRQRLVAIDALNPAIDKIEALAQQADLTNLPALNKFLSAGKFQLGDRTITNYRQLQTLLGDEAGNALGVGTGSDLKTKLGLDLVNTSLGPKQFVDTMEQLRSLLGQRKDLLLKQMGPYASAAGGGNAAPPAAAPPAATDDKPFKVAAPDGRTYGFKTAADAAAFKARAGIK